MFQAAVTLAVPSSVVSGAVPAQAVPGWLLAGLFLGALFAALILGAFVAGERLLPAGGGPSSDRARDRGERLRREEIRYYLQAIGERFEEDVTVEGREVAFYLPERDVAVTFDARSFLLLREGPVHPILVEHEMPGVHIGTRMPFETPDVGLGPGGDAQGEDTAGGTFGAAQGGPGPAFGDRRGHRRHDAGDVGAPPDNGGDGESVRAAYAVLGLPPTADAETVRTAYRERVKEVHPDQGGDPEAFQRLQEAYATVEDDLDLGTRETRPAAGPESGGSA